MLLYVTYGVMLVERHFERLHTTAKREEEKETDEQAGQGEVVTLHCSGSIGNMK